MFSMYDLAFYKEMYTGHKILYVLINNKEFVFKSLGRKEYQNILTLTSDEYELEDAICQTSLIYPEYYNFAEAPMSGVSNTVSPLILEMSGFSELDTVMDMYIESKNKVKVFEQQCMGIVKAAFPEYRYDEMEEWTWEQLMDFTARAEFVLTLLEHEVTLIDKSEEVMEEVKKQSEEQYRDELVKKLRDNGIDPMMYFSNEFIQKKDYLDFPLIGGIHWENEGVLNEIRRQMETCK